MTEKVTKLANVVLKLADVVLPPFEMPDGRRYEGLTLAEASRVLDGYPVLKKEDAK